VRGVDGYRPSGQRTRTGRSHLGPTSGKLGKLIEEKGPDDPEAQKTLARILAVSRVDLLVLLLIVIDMVVKPGL
jgi:hypothetical protein